MKTTIKRGQLVRVIERPAMNKRYENGTARRVILCMAEYAIRDQEDLIEAYTPMFGQPDAEAVKVIEECRSLIRDFKKFADAHGIKKGGAA